MGIDFYMVIYRLFIIINNVLYRILGDKMSTRLAHSKIGRLVFRLFFGTKETIQIQTLEGIKIQLPLNDVLTLGIGHLGVVNRNETAVCKKILKKGDIVIDVGTYIDGWYSLLAAKLVGGEGQVYAFEPHPLYYKLLENNIKLNSITNITAIKRGVSDRVGTFNFYEGGIGSSLIKSHVEDVTGKIKGKNYGRAIKIKTTTLNKFVKDKQIKRIALIKIDVEGADMKVLKGAINILKGADGPNFIVEVVDQYLQRAGSSREELLNYMDNFGYKPYYFTQFGLKPYAEKKEKTVINLFFSKKKIEYI